MLPVSVALRAAVDPILRRLVRIASALGRSGLGLGLGLGVAWILAGAGAASAQPCSDSAEVAVFDGAFAPDSVCIVAGGRVHWTHSGAFTRDVVEDSGRFNSGYLATGGAFSITLQEPGTHSYGSTFEPTMRGHIVVAMSGLEGPADALARDMIPDVAFPQIEAGDFGPHPLWHDEISRTRLMLGFSDSCTVAEANAAFEDAAVVVLGGLPSAGILLVAAERSEDFSALEAAHASLLASACIRGIARDSLMETDTLPRPRDSATVAALSGDPEFTVAAAWEWDVVRTSDDEHPSGVGGNWPLEASRVPQAWSLREAVVRKGRVDEVRTAVVDAGFSGAHPDLARTRKLTTVIKDTPSGPVHSANLVHEHGQLTSGIIAAEYDNDSGEGGRSLGVSGVNPFARVDAISYGFLNSLDDGALSEFYEIMVLASEQIPELKLISLSIGGPGHQELVKIWWTDPLWGAEDECGPGDGDDGLPGTGVCTLDTHDGWRARVREEGELARPLFELLAANDVLVLQSAGNSSSRLCVDRQPSPCETGGYASFTDTTQRAGWVAHNWTHPTLPNPIIVVEALARGGDTPGETFLRSFYSTLGGDVSGPADGFSRIAGASGYAFQQFGGTSSATPHVAGLVGMLRAYDPDLTSDEVRRHLVEWARSDVSPNDITAGAESLPGAPRMDAFASLLSLPGAATLLVDVNDESLDGNRRVVRGRPTPLDPDGPVLGPDLDSSSEVEPVVNRRYRTAPDEWVDMRDFRRFRDAWVQVCLEGGIENCPTLSRAVLDGADDHPKKDLNFDGCVYDEADPDACPPENTFPRFDFNGDGVISLSDDRLVPLRPDGSPAADIGEATRMTDLEVLASQWKPNPDADEGWGPGDLGRLMNSIDLDLYADQFFANGASVVEVSLTDPATGEALPVRRILPGEHIVYTVPVGPTWTLSARAVTPAGDEYADPNSIETDVAGDDFRLDLCKRKLVVTASPAAIRANGTATSQVTATLQTCPTDALGLVSPEVTFEIEPSGAGHATLASPAVGFDPLFRAVDTFTAGTIPDTYTVTATATIDLGDGAELPIGGSVTIETLPPQRIYYRWQETILEFEQSGSSRWPNYPGVTDALTFPCADAILSGVVFDPDEAPETPLEGATVTIRDSAEPPVQTDADGRFEFPPLDLGEGPTLDLVIQATLDARVDVERSLSLMCGQLTDVQMGGPDTGEPRLGSIRGVVRRRDLQTPVAGASVVATYGERTVTDASGSYELLLVPLPADGDPPGTDPEAVVVVNVFAPSFAPTSESITVGPGDPSVLDFELRPPDCEEWGDLLFARCGDDFSQAAETTDPDTGESVEQVLTREGVLVNEPDGVRLSETVGGGPIVTRVSWETTSPFDPPGAPLVDDLEGQVRIQVTPDDLQRHQDHPLEEASISDTAAGLRVDGLGAIGDLPYRHETTYNVSGTYANFTPETECCTWEPLDHKIVSDSDIIRGITAFVPASAQPELMLVPRADGSSFRYAPDGTSSITFAPGQDGGFRKYEFCELQDLDYEIQPAYFSTLSLIRDPLGFDRGLWNRNHTFQPYTFLAFSGASILHEYPMPVGPAHSRIRYSFVAVPYNTDAELQEMLDGGELDLPVCGELPLLVPDFSVDPEMPGEGSVVHFRDESVTGGNSIVEWLWDFGDGETSPEPEPSHRYRDDGDYVVTLTVVDASGNVESVQKPLAVENRPPFAELDPAFAHPGEGALLLARIGDPGDADQALLNVNLASEDGIFEPISQIYPAGIQPFLVIAPGPGTYPVTLTVRDKDEAEATATSELIVLSDGEEPPAPVEPEPEPTCDPGTSLTGEASLLLSLLNDYRALLGVAPLRASPALTRAAGRHAADLAAGGFLSHIGSDGSEPGTRAADAGYPSQDVQEVVLSGVSQARNALFAWMSSSDHNATLLGSTLAAAGIARQQSGDEWTWVADFGREVDCPGETAALERGPDALLATSAGPDPGLGDDVLVMSSGGGSMARSVMGPVVSLVSTGMMSVKGAARAVAQALAAAVEPPGPAAVPALALSSLVLDGGQILRISNRSRDASGAPIAATLDLGDGSEPMDLAAGAVTTTVFALAGTYSIALTVPDAALGSVAVARSVEVLANAPVPGPDPDPGGDPDFGLSLFPGTLVMNPGDAVDFSVIVAPQNGFAAPVTLTVSPLPPGVTATLADPVVTPPITTSLHLESSADAAVGDFDLNLVGEGGGLTRTTASQLRIDFGLIPVCTGSVTGRVVSAETGEPLPGSKVAGVLTDADGHYLVEDVGLGYNNAPRTETLNASAPGYYARSGSVVVACDEVSTLDFQLLPVLPDASIVGRVVEGELDFASDGSFTIVPTETPLPNVYVASNRGHQTRTDEDGRYRITGLDFPGGVDTQSYVMRAADANYWGSAQIPLTLRPGETGVANFVMVPYCQVSFSITLRYRDGEPFADEFVQFGSTAPGYYTTDSEGRFDSLPQRLALDRTYYYGLTVSETDERERLSASLTADECGQHVEGTFIVDRRVRRGGDLAGYVKNAETGEPVAGATVIASGRDRINQTASTDASGRYAFSDLQVGYNDELSYDTSVRVTGTTEYDGDQKNVTLLAATTVQAPDLIVVPYKFGGFRVTVRDAVTGLPIEGVRALQPFVFQGYTDADGVIEVTGLREGTSIFFELRKQDYWTRQFLGGFSIVGDTITEVEYELLPVCEGATLVGSVSDASTGLPLEGATVSTSCYPDSCSQNTLTDANGNYVLPGVSAGNLNTPHGATVTASKSGFITQSRVVTVFCSARITVEFGQPPGELGAIEGTVTDGDGMPLAGVFIGSGFGAADTTDGQGDYAFTEVPLGPDDADREWEITADPDDLDPQTRAVVAKAGEVVRLDFVFGGNQAPVADAGDDVNAVTGQSVSLDGSDSFDPDGDLITFDWSLDRGSRPAASTLTDADLQGADSAMPSFTPDVDGAYSVELVVNDGELDSPPDSVQVEARTPNSPPNADAGETQSVFLGDPVQLDASGSSDPDGGPQPLAFAWRFVSLPAGSALGDADIAGADSADAGFTPDVEGVYVLAVDASDGEAIDSDEVEIRVEHRNVPPNARAGDDLEVTLGETAILDGSASDDPDGGPAALAFEWRFVSVPMGSALDNADIAGALTPQPSFTPDLPGAYVLELGVNDGEESDFDNVAVLASEPDPDPPAPVLDLSARAKPEKIDLTWTPSPEAVAYRILRATGEPGQGPYEVIAETHQTSTGVYADFGLTNGVTYSYVVHVLAADGRESAASNPAWATPQARESR